MIDVAVQATMEGTPFSSLSRAEISEETPATKAQVQADALGIYDPSDGVT